MNLNYKLVEGDTIRQIRIRLTSTEVPTEATLVLVKGTARLEFGLTKVVDLWTHDFTDEEFEEFTDGSWRGQVHAKFSDGSEGTYPTEQHINVRVYKKL
jgi:hypothetical protein